MAAVTPLHLQGMGVLGSLTAWELHKRGIQFTWNDTNTETCAWRACTGSIFPTGHQDDVRGMTEWSRWMDGGAAWASMPALRACVEYATWWYSTKAPPHSATGEPDVDLGALRRLPAGSIHFNAQTFVPMTRDFFMQQQRQAQPAGSRLVVSHGFGERLDRYVWGWTVPVVLTGDPRLMSGGRPAIYCREGRFIMAYAYPIANTPHWYAGSSLIVQKKAKALEVGPKFDRWRRDFMRLTGGLVQSVTPAGPAVMGWRPRAADLDTRLVRVANDGAIQVRPMWHNGVRLAPLVVAEVVRELEAA